MRVETRFLMTINIKGQLMDFAVAKVMAIINVTPDSFFSGSRSETAGEIRQRVRTVKEEGADILDIGGYSSRPGADEVSAEEEYSRLARGLEIVRTEWPEAVVSVDTFRSDVARRCIEEWGVDIVNDISGGTLDPDMWRMVGDLKPVYVLMHMRGTPATMQTLTDYADVTAEVISDLSRKCYDLRGLGVNDIIIDPGFGFAKTVEQNFKMLRDLEEFCKMGMPVLAGLSRKSMIWRKLGITPEESLTGTIALNTMAIERGANILRVHDVKPAKEIISLLTTNSQPTTNN